MDIMFVGSARYGAQNAGYAQCGQMDMFYTEKARIIYKQNEDNMQWRVTPDILKSRDTLQVGRVASAINVSNTKVMN